jgi:hypothetical protein
VLLDQALEVGELLGGVRLGLLGEHGEVLRLAPGLVGLGAGGVGLTPGVERLLHDRTVVGEHPLHDLGAAGDVVPVAGVDDPVGEPERRIGRAVLERLDDPLLEPLDRDGLALERIGEQVLGAHQRLLGDDQRGRRQLGFALGLEVVRLGLLGGDPGPPQLGGRGSQALLDRVELASGGRQALHRGGEHRLGLGQLGLEVGDVLLVCGRGRHRDRQQADHDREQQRRPTAHSVHPSPPPARWGRRRTQERTRTTRVTPGRSGTRPSWHIGTPGRDLQRQTRASARLAHERRG